MILDQLKEKHAVIGDVRGAGLFATIEFVADRKTREPMTPYGKSPSPNGFMSTLARALRQRRVHIASKWTQLFIAPLCIDEALLTEGLELISESIEEASKTL